jgi:glycosyltransferase involved in cell wall biosynthesis
VPRVVRHAAAIIADSSATRTDIIARLKVDPSRIHVIPLGVSAHFSARDTGEARRRIGEALSIDAPYILALGTLEPRKNLTTVLNAYARLGSDAPILVLAGARGWKDSPVFEQVKRAGLSARVVFSGFVSDGLLPDLYAGARAFVYPSLYEGFGLPVLEAMACGVPVITSKTSSLPEVAGDAALLIDPTDVDELADAMQRVLSDASLSDELRKRGLRRASHFTWERTARETLDVYRIALGLN